MNSCLVTGCDIAVGIAGVRNRPAPTTITFAVYLIIIVFPYGYTFVHSVERSV